MQNHEPFFWFMTYGVHFHRSLVLGLTLGIYTANQFLD